jgi:UDP-N-acetylglucosamine--N-acetylmuramyl-(pentapeptide) pyrophosphoryl-undecaprenol N-acetylglucosamine transferase
MSDSRPTVLIAAAGTGGHIYPGIAVAQQLRERRPDVRIVFLGSNEGLEKDIVPRYGFEIVVLSARKIKGMGLRGILGFLFLAPFIAIQALIALWKIHPRVIFGTGAYATALPLRLAALFGIPVYLHESNAKPGLTNKWLGKVARHSFLNFAEAAAFFPHGRSTVVGMPVRLSAPKASNRQVQFPTTAGLHVLLLGGSQGSRPLNRFIMKHADTFFSDPGITLVHQTGEKNHDEVMQRHREVRAEIQQRWIPVPFIENMPDAYQWADVCICRAGSSTLAELLEREMPAVLVPFPFAADDHQRANAKSFENRGFAFLIDEKELDPKLFEIMRRVTADSEVIQNMKSRLRGEKTKLSEKTNAATQIAETLARQV